MAKYYIAHDRAGVLELDGAAGEFATHSKAHSEMARRLALDSAYAPGRVLLDTGAVCYQDIPAMLQDDPLVKAIVQHVSDERQREPSNSEKF